MRRKVMGWLLAVLIAACFLCSGPFASWIEERPIVFLLTWSTIFFLLLGTAGLALYDLLILRAAARAARNALKKRIFQESDSSSSRK
jgi:hypothetical protein